VLKKGNYFLAGLGAPVTLSLAVGTGTKVQVVRTSEPSVGTVVQFVQTVWAPPPSFTTEQLTGLVLEGPDATPWRLILTADTTRGARREIESLKNNISVKQVE
jgi:hypothetical protein